MAERTKATVLKTVSAPQMKTIPTRHHDLGAEGTRWVSRSLERGRTLARLVLAYRDISRGDVSAEQPRDLSSHAITEAFDGGGLPQARQAREATLRVFAEMADQDAEGILLVEDELGRPDDPAVMRSPYHALIHDDEVFPWVPLPQDPPELARFLSWSTSGYPTNAFLLRQDQMPETSPVGIDALEELACGIRAILVGAFDGEGYVIWSEGMSVGDPSAD
jgi:hypothetical protein